MNLDTLFAEALELPAADRPAYLDAHCPDPAVRGQLDRLLGAHARAGKFLADTPVAADTHPPDDPAADPPPPELPGGRYRVSGVLGRGGMGLVYRAEQVDPIRRAVAVKVVRPGLASPLLLGRFEAERQTVAALSHPHIAAVFDGGSTPDGRPYFVMELVESARPITRYCADRGLSFAEKLSLFFSACDAVKHAHARGVLHRDLKPSNVLVGTSDGRAVVKVIDFGVAKALAVPADSPSHTRPGTLVGTPEYMSPEQADLSARDIDVRSDVYSLAVLLFELVTGDTPVPAARVTAAPLLDVLQAVRTEEAPAVGAKARGLPPELDWIVAKGLSKGRDRRYPTVAAFADDLARMTRHEAVVAAPTGGLYRAGKFVRRNWLAVSAAVAVFASLVAGTVGTSVGMVRAQDAERTAEARRVQADESAEKATKAETEAKAHAAAAETASAAATDAAAKAKRSEEVAVRERDSATAMLRFFTDDVLALGTVKQQSLNRMPIDPDVRLMTVIDAAAPKIDAQFAGRPELELRLRTMVGDYYAKSGQPAKALPHLKRAAELLAAATHLSDAERVDLLYWLGVGFGGCRDFQTAHDHFAAGVRLADGTKSVPPNMSAALALGRIGAAAELGPPAPLLLDLERLTDSIAADFGPTCDLSLDAGLTKGVLLMKAEKFRDAVTHLTALLKTAEDRKATLHACRVRLLLACALVQFNEFKQAEQLFTRVVKEEQVIFGRQDRNTVRTLYLLGNCRLNLNDTTGAMSCFAECRAWYQADETRADGKFASLLNELAYCHTRKGEYAKAAECFAEAAGMSERLTPTEVLTTAELRYNAARAFHIARDSDKAFQHIGPAVAGMRAGKETTDLLPLALELNAALLCQRNEHAAAEPLAAECVTLCEKRTPGVELLYRAESGLGVALAGQGKYADAEPHHLAAVKGITDLRTRAKQPLTDPQYRAVVRRLIDLYEVWGKPDEAAKWEGQLPKPTKK